MQTTEKDCTCADGAGEIIKSERGDYMTTVKTQADKTINDIQKAFGNKVEHLYSYIYAMKKILEPKIQTDADIDESRPIEQIIFCLLDSCEDSLEGLEFEAGKMYTKLEEISNEQISSVRLMQPVGEDQ